MSRAIGKIIEIDGHPYEYTGVIWVNGWLIIGSADNFDCSILDKNGIKAIRGGSALAGERACPSPGLAKPQRIENLKTETWTNIERVLIYVDRFGPD